MNNRQKAKHFKKLYESMLYQAPNPVIYKEPPLKKYRCRIIIPDSDKEEAIDEITQHFKELVNEHIEYNKELGCYEQTLWLKE